MPGMGAGFFIFVVCLLGFISQAQASTLRRSFETSLLPCHNPLQTPFFLKPQKFRENTCCFCEFWNAGFPSCLSEKPVGKLWNTMNQVETSEHLLCLPLTKTMPPLCTFFQPSNHFLHLQICSLMVHCLALFEGEGGSGAESRGFADRCSTTRTPSSYTC